MLKIQIIGNLGRDAEIKDFNGQKFVSFSVAVTEKYKNKNGETVENTTWVSCLKSIREDSTLVNYLKKGQKVYLEGKPTVKLYQNKEGHSEIAFNCNVTHLELLSTVSSTEPTQHQPQAVQQANEPIQEDGNMLPF